MLCDKALMHETSICQEPQSGAGVGSEMEMCIELGYCSQGDKQTSVRCTRQTNSHHKTAVRAAWAYLQQHSLRPGNGQEGWVKRELGLEQQAEFG